MKFSLKNDYAEGCHPRILEVLAKTNLHQQAGYGHDVYCQKAEELIKKLLKSEKSKVYFVSGGTQANLIIISAFLRPHESVVAVNTGHIATNEAGAIEATGHKINEIFSEDGKIYPQQIQEVLDLHQNKPHQVKQKMVYISNSTEVGTIYTKSDLENLSAFCKQNGLLLFMDGARLGHALTAEHNDLTLEDVAALTDAFYLGGTKNGALIGEAIVINNPELQEDFGFHVKQKGAMLAKGRLLGIQFLELLQDGLYFELAKHANVQAMKLKKAFSEAGYSFLSETSTNQIFPILSNRQIEILSEHFEFYVWKKIDENHSAIRIITSWATEDETINRMIETIQSMP